VDLALPAASVDYALIRDIARLAPYGPGHPDPLVAVLDLGVGRVRAANGGHAQLVLRRERDVLDGIAFGREDLVGALTEGARVDVVARVASRSFAGVESLQLELRDIGPAGSFAPARIPLSGPAVTTPGLAVGTT
jgi:single-stranded-DNA-specific exonuclease